MKPPHINRYLIHRTVFFAVLAVIFIAVVAGIIEAVL